MPRPPALLPRLAATLRAERFDRAATRTLLRSTAQGQPRPTATTPANALDALAHALPGARPSRETREERIGFAVGFTAATSMQATPNRRKHRRIARAMGQLLASAIGAQAQEVQR